MRENKIAPSFLSKFEMKNITVFLLVKWRLQGNQILYFRSIVSPYKFKQQKLVSQKNVKELEVLPEKPNCKTKYKFTKEKPTIEQRMKFGISSNLH
jgi:hypothetical protein